MSTTERDRNAIRRAALRRALRHGDTVAAARAWERLRVEDNGLAREEVHAARRARASVGRALRDARTRRAEALAGPRLELVGTFPAFETSWARYQGAISSSVLFLFVFALFLVVSPPRPHEGPAPAAAAPELTAVAQPEPTRAVTGGRGRTSATEAPVVALTAPPTPQPTAEPTAAPTAAPRTGAPARTAAVGAVPGGQSGGVPGGVPSGTPGGVVGGVPGATGRATPSPTPTVNVLPLNPPPLASGADRFLFRVIDARTGRPLDKVCVIYGTLTCTANDPHTNLNGYFWLDLVPPAATNWSFRFLLDGYVPVTVNKTYRQSQGTVITTVDLRRR